MPSKEAAVILFKVKAGCVIPWHWHTPAERIVVKVLRPPVRPGKGGAIRAWRTRSYATAG